MKTMGHISDLPADVLWLILRHAIYADYHEWFDNLDRVIQGEDVVFRFGGHFMFCTLSRYGHVCRQWFRVVRLKMQGETPGWKFVRGVWFNYERPKIVYKFVGRTLIKSYT
jgi:hypothetical protein